MSLSRLWQQQGKKEEARQMLSAVYNRTTVGSEPIAYFLLVSQSLHVSERFSEFFHEFSDDGATRFYTVN